MCDTGDGHAARGYQVAQNPTKQIAQHGKPKDSSRIPAYYLEASGGNNTACGAIFFTGGVVFR